MLLCLGLDYKRGGFVDRALEAFTEVLRLDPDNQYALSNLEKLYEEQHQWAEAYATRQKLAARGGADEAAAAPGDPRVPRERDRARGAEAEGLSPKPRGGSTPPSTSMRTNAPAYLEPRATCGTSRATSTAAIAAWERLIEHVARARVPGVRAARGRVRDRRRAPARFPDAVPPADRRQPPGLARPARAGAALTGARPTRRGAGAALRGARRSTRTRWRCTRRSGRRSRTCS